MIYFFVLLLRLVAYLDGKEKILSFVGVFAIISFSTIKRSTLVNITKISKANFIALIVIFLIGCHSLILGQLQARDVAVLLTYWIWFVFTMAYFKNKTVEEGLYYILITFLIFNIANYVFFELFFADQKRGINALMRIFGFHGYRIYFPLSSGANVYTFQVGINALLALYFIKIRKSKIIYILIYWFYIFVLILADSRLILLFTFFFSFIYWYSLKSIIYVLKKYWVWVIISIIGLIFLFYNTSLFDIVKRPGEKTGEAVLRTDIWGYALNVIFDDYKCIMGHGLNGLETNIPIVLKESFEDQHLQTSHNFFLQNIVDFGLVGILLIIFLLYRILKMTMKLKSRIVTIIMIMFLFIGTTESIPTFYSFDATVFFIAIIALIITKHEGEIVRYT